MTLAGQRPLPLIMAAIMLVVVGEDAFAGVQRSVVELYTSQGCSSCPPADAVVGRLSADPGVLVLSFHVNYWDYLGWKDRYSSPASTDRQYAYAKTLRESSVFTPQLIVNGSWSLVGSQEDAVREAVTAANRTGFAIHANLFKQADGHISLTLAGPPIAADLWEVRYVRRSSTVIRSGENGGRTLQTYNDVTQVNRIGPYHAGTLDLAPLRKPDDGIAVLVQAPETGRILGAAAY